MKIPFVDLHAQYLSIQADIDAAISRTIRDSAYIGGASVRGFEEAFAEYMGLSNVIGCANGTDSMEMLLKAFGIGPGDEVIVPAHSWISTSEAVGNAGATPVFVDVEIDFFTIDTTKIEAAITERTKGIIPVHLYGHPADMPAIIDIADRFGLKVIEDCAQSHGAAIGGKKAGTFGHAASFSFYPGKNLGAYGDAGCVATNDPELAEKVRMIANHGQRGKHNHLMEGRNSRLDGLQAAILSAKLPWLEQWTEARISHAAAYARQLEGSGLSLPMVKPGYRHVYHVYAVRTEHRSMLMDGMKTAGVETAIHYPTALPFLPCYASNGSVPADFPAAYKNQSRILSLPMFAELTDEQITHVASIAKSLLNVSIEE
jgi:dTDP-4-amino-4,6-dideoxygalactose transaminase